MLALKEWAIAIEALLKGEQCLILRKGGIHEETKQFELKSPYFLLFPAFEHQKEHLVQNQFIEQLKVLRAQGMSNPLPMMACAEVVKEWLIHDLKTVQELSAFHIWKEEMVEMRLHWKKTQPLHVIALRVFKMNKDVLLEDPQTYAGCKSWFELPIEKESFSEKLEQVCEEEKLQQMIREIDRLVKSHKI